MIFLRQTTTMPILVIVESGAKGPKIEHILGKGYIVRACYGHMQDIPHNLKWIPQHAEEHNWDPNTIPYEPSNDSKKTIASLRKLAKTASKVIIASDMDREGEAIGFHIRDLLHLQNKPMERIVFDQITPEAIHHAIANPTELREPLYHAQQARRVVDLLFGYTISPLLWDIQQRLSAGRCQSPALRWMWERQVPFMKLSSILPRHTITAALQKGKHDPFNAKYKNTATRTKPNPDKHHELKVLEHFAAWTIIDIAQKSMKQNPPQALTTSALQQKCYQRFKWGPKTTMSLAQKLYEAGHITYMRTDCKVLSKPFVKDAHAFLHKTYGPDYIGSTSDTNGKRKSKKQELAQEAHEPVRPVKCQKHFLSSSELGGFGSNANQSQMLYTLIYECTLSSLMSPCVSTKYALTLHPHDAKTKVHRLEKEFAYIQFPGFRVWEVDQPFEPQQCPYNVSDTFKCVNYISEVKYPLPIHPYSSGELLKALETNGIGRPSTYGPIIDRLEARNYIVSNKNGSHWQQALENHPLTQNKNEEIQIDMKPKTPKWTTTEIPNDIVKQLGDRYFVTPTGGAVIDYLLAQEKLKALIDSNFTKTLEAQLDDITTGQSSYAAVVGTFYARLQEAVKSVPRHTKSGIESFRNHPTKRLLEEHEDHYFGALLTRNGPAVAMFYKDPKKKKEGMFANIPNPHTIQDVSVELAKKLLSEKQNQSEDSKRGHFIGKHEGKTIFAKTGRFGHYLVWNNETDTIIPEHTTAFVNKTVSLEDVTLEQANEWISKAKITLRKINKTYTVKYNPQSESLYLSKPNSKSRGRPVTATLTGFTLDDRTKIEALRSKDCDTIFEEKQAQKTPIKKPRATKTKKSK